LAGQGALGTSPGTRARPDADIDAAHLIVHSLAPSSRNTYRRALLLFIQHTNSANNNLPLPFPATIAALIKFITTLYANNYAPSTITTFVSAIAFVNKLYGAHDPHQHFLVIKMLEGTRKLGHTVDTRQPITLSILHKLISSLPIVHHHIFPIALLKAMFLIAFHAFLRVGEMTVRAKQGPSHNTLQVADCTVNFRAPQVSSISITLRSSKHNQARPFHITIPANNTKNCPAVAIHQYLALARPKQGPLFQTQDGNPVTRHYFQSQLHRCLQAANIDTTAYKTHSFRIGAATEAVASLGLPDHEVQRLGRWGSNAFKSYIRTPHFTTPNR
jgi:integrase